MKSRRLKREEKTIRAMISIYCKHHHATSIGNLCKSCTVIQDYALKRLWACPFQEKKPTCANCLIHCYIKDMQENVRKVMRYSGPRLTLRHPILAICHILDSRIKPPTLKPKTSHSSNNQKERDGNSL